MKMIRGYSKRIRPCQWVLTRDLPEPEKGSVRSSLFLAYLNSKLDTLFNFYIN